MERIPKRNRLSTSRWIGLCVAASAFLSGTVRAEDAVRNRDGQAAATREPSSPVGGVTLTMRERTDAARPWGNAILEDRLTPRRDRPIRDPDIEELKRVLEDTRNATILAYLKRETRPVPDPAATAKWISLLDSPAFQERERASAALSRGGPALIAPLRVAQSPAGAEKNRRLTACIAAIQQEWNYRRVATFRAAVRVLVDRQPEGAAECLFRLLPMLHDDALAADVQFALDEMAVRDNKVVRLVEDFVSDSDADRRAFVGYLLGRRGTAAQKEKARVLLGDPVNLVRLRTAQGFLGSGDKSAVPVLIDLLAKKPVFVAWQAEELLAWVAGEEATLEMPVIGEGRDALKCQDVWEDWWQKNRDRADLRLLVNEPRRPMLLYVHVGNNSRDHGLVLGCDGRQRWMWITRDSYRIERFFDDDRFLYCWRSANASKDRYSETGWTGDLRETHLGANPTSLAQWNYHMYERLGFPESSERLMAGLTVVTGTKMWSFPDRDGLHFDIRAENPLGMWRWRSDDGGEVKKVVWRRESPTFPKTPRLDVFDRLGGHVASFEEGCTYVTRLRNGHFLIADMDRRPRLLELDAEKRLVWEAPFFLWSGARLTVIFPLLRLGIDELPAHRADDAAWFQRRVKNAGHCDAAIRYLAFQSLRFDYLDKARAVIPQLREAIRKEAKKRPSFGGVSNDSQGHLENLLDDLGLPRK